MANAHFQDESNKRCSRCGQSKVLTEFRITRYSKLGKPWFCSWCKNCNRIYLNTPDQLEKAKWRQRKVRYGKFYGGGEFVRAAYEKKVKEQGGICFICGIGPTEKRSLDLDHCHTCGKIRKLLCSRCNLLVGRIENNPAILDYLKLHSHLSF